MKPITAHYPAGNTSATYRDFFLGQMTCESTAPHCTARSQCLPQGLPARGWWGNRCRYRREACILNRAVGIHEKDIFTAKSLEFIRGQFSGPKTILLYTRAVFGRLADPGLLPDAEPAGSATFLPITTLILGFVTISVACRASQPQDSLENETTLFACTFRGGSRHGATFCLEWCPGVYRYRYCMDAFIPDRCAELMQSVGSLNHSSPWRLGGRRLKATPLHGA